MEILNFGVDDVSMRDCVKMHKEVRLRERVRERQSAIRTLRENELVCSGKERILGWRERERGRGEEREEEEEREREREREERRERHREGANKTNLLHNKK